MLRIRGSHAPIAVVYCLVWAFLPGTLTAQISEGEPLPVRMLNKAWAAYEQGKNTEAATLAEKVILEFEVEAQATQRELLAKNEPPPGTGRVSQAEKERIFSFGPLNEVATAWWIKGRALAKEDKNKQAIEALRHVKEYPHARTYDKDWGGFWSPADKAQAWIDQLESRPQSRTGATPR